MAEQAVKEPVKHAERFTGDVTIELGDERNRNFIWPPTRGELRGRWLRRNLLPNEAGTEEMSAIPDIAGMYIRVEGRHKRLTIVDPLSLPENESLRRDVAKAFKDALKGEWEPSKGSVIENATETQIKTWLWFLHRFIEGSPRDTTQSGKLKTGGPNAQVVSGTMPTAEEIMALPGKIRIQQFNSSPGAIKYLEDMPADV